MINLDVMPTPLSEVSRAELKSVRAVFFDIDDTFSTEGRILPQAYDALWSLHRAGLIVVPVTGRPAGWCDMIARMWPVSAVVGENGAFYMYMEKQDSGLSVLRKKYLEASKVRKKNALRLKKLHSSILRAFPQSKVASDQPYREFDLAIDYCEDVRPWPSKKVSHLLEFCHSRGAAAKLSSIHVNTWFGRYDKLTCVQRILSQLFSMNLTKNSTKIIYIGDSPNDEPFFKALPLTVGVANIKKFLEQGSLEHPPKYITTKPGGEGFAEFAEALLNAKKRLAWLR